MLATKAADMESKITSSKHVLTDEEVKALFESMDDDNDGQLTQEEIIGTLLLQGIK